jgi:serine protease
MKRRLLMATVVAASLIAGLLAAPPSGAARRPQRVIVGFRAGTHIRAAVRSVGGTVLHRYRLISGVVAVVPDGALQDLRHEHDIAWAQRDLLRHIDGLLEPEQVYRGDPEFLPWSVGDVRADRVWDSNEDLDVDGGAAAGQGVTVAVIDNGLDATHPDLASAWDLALSDCFIQDIDPNCTAQDDIAGPDQGHGVAAASVVAARANDVGIIGVAPKATIVAYRAGDSASGTLADSAIVAAIERAIEDRVDVINMSFGGPASSPAERAMLAVAYERGIVSVASAGNGNDHIGSKPPVEFPAKLPTVIAVGAVDQSNTLADFSSFGNGLELVAPGVGIPVAVVQGTAVDGAFIVDSPTGGGSFQNTAMELSPTGSATGAVVSIGLGTAADVAGLDLSGKIALIERGSITFAEKVANAASAGASAAVIFNNAPGPIGGTLGTLGPIPTLEMPGEDGQTLLALVQAKTVKATVAVGTTDWASWNGTSFSAPSVAGVAALLLSVEPGLTPRQVRTAMDTTAVDLGRPGYDLRYGFGLVNACAAVRSVGGSCPG